MMKVKLKNNIATFIEYRRQISKFQLHAGLRYEHTNFDYYQDRVHQKEQSKKYNEFFPSASISTSLGKVNIQIGYGQDILRPDFYSLRSSIFYANHYTYETGNPFLRPTITHNLSITGVYKWWQLYASYQKQKDDVMFDMEPYSEEDPNIVLIKPVNIKSYNVFYARLTATPIIGPWSPRLTLATRKQWFGVETHDGKIDMDKMLFSFRWQNSLKLPTDILLGLDCTFYNKYDEGNTRLTDINWGIDANLQRNFFNDRLTLQLNGYDIFLTRRYNHTNYFNPIYMISKTTEPKTRSVSFTVRYRFNQGKDKYKGTGAGESQKNRL